MSFTEANRRNIFRHFWVVSQKFCEFRAPSAKFIIPHIVTVGTVAFWARLTHAMSQHNDVIVGLWGLEP